MSKKRAQLNCVCADRLKVMLKNEKISQIKLAKDMDVAQQSISRIMQQKQPLTLEMSKEIIFSINQKTGKEYRLAWLLGMDDFMFEDQFNSRLGIWYDVSEKLPPIGERVLVYAIRKGNSNNTIILITEMSDSNWFDYNLKTKPYWVPPFQYFLADYDITHWMYLPEPPERK